jgi:hypothetical protein
MHGLSEGDLRWARNWAQLPDRPAANCVVHRAGISEFFADSGRVRLLLWAPPWARSEYFVWKLVDYYFFVLPQSSSVLFSANTESIKYTRLDLNELYWLESLAHYFFILD